MMNQKAGNPHVPGWAKGLAIALCLFGSMAALLGAGYTVHSLYGLDLTMPEIAMLALAAGGQGALGLGLLGLGQSLFFSLRQRRSNWRSTPRVARKGYRRYQASQLS